MIDASQREFGLLPEGADQFWSALHGLQSPSSEVAHLGKVRGAQVGDLVLLQIGPDRLNRVKFGRIRGQEGDSDAPVLRFEPVLDESALVRPHAVPDDQQRLLQVSAQRLEELDVLLLLDRAFVQTE